MDDNINFLSMLVLAGSGGGAVCRRTRHVFTLAMVHLIANVTNVLLRHHA
ncbi:MAG: hypothetical protein ACLT1T_11895 [Oscillospiraceae bacterium]